MYTFTNDYRDGFKSGIRNSKFRTNYYTTIGETLSDSLSSNTSTLFDDCVYMGYLDARRKFTGIAKMSLTDKMDCLHWLAVQLRFYFSQTVLNSCTAFDNWHRDICNGLIKQFSQKGLNNVSVGMAQKVINLSFKYLHCCNYGTVSIDYFKFCHMALDDYTLRWYTRVINPQNIIKEWSPINNYADYFDIQKKTRSYLMANHKNSNRESLIINEFYIWPDEFVIENLTALRNTIEKYSNCIHVNTEIRGLYKNPIDSGNPQTTINDFLSNF